MNLGGIFLRIHDHLNLPFQSIHRHGRLNLIRKGKSMDSLLLQNRNMGIHTGFEIQPRAQLLRGPSDLRHRQSTWEHHILQMLRILDVFCPGIRLHAHDMLLLLRVQ